MLKKGILEEDLVFRGDRVVRITEGQGEVGEILKAGGNMGWGEVKSVTCRVT